MREETLEPLVYLASKLRSLEGKLTVAQAKRLVALPAELGFSSTDEFLAAFRLAIGAEPTAPANDAGPPAQPAQPAPSLVEAGSDELTESTSAESNESNVQGNIDDAEEVSVPASSDLTSEDIETEVKKLIAAGKTRAEISTELGISESKVRAIRRKLGLGRKKTGVAAKSGATKPRSPRKRGSAKQD